MKSTGSTKNKLILIALTTVYHGYTTRATASKSKNYPSFTKIHFWYSNYFPGLRIFYLNFFFFQNKNSHFLFSKQFIYFFTIFFLLWFFFAFSFAFLFLFLCIFFLLLFSKKTTSYNSFFDYYYFNSLN